MRGTIGKMIELSGAYTLTATDPATGVVTARIDAQNRIVLAGRQYLAKMLAGRLDSKPAPLTHTAIGLGGARTREKHERLENELRRERVNSLPTHQTTGAFTIILQAHFPAIAVPGLIREVGCFISPDAMPTSRDTGVLFSRALLEFDNREARQDLTLQWQITMSAS